MKYKYFISLAISLLLLFNSCSVSKKIAVNNTLNKKVKIDEVYEQALKNEPSFSSMDISKLNLTLNLKAQTVNIKGFLKLITDSVILISAQPLPGIEVARIYITKDSVFVLDRFNAQYYSMEIDSLKQKTGLDFDFQTMQTLLCNQIFLSGKDKKQISKDMFEVSSFPAGYNLKANEGTSSFNQDFILNPLLRIDKSILMDKKNPYSLTCEYSDFAKIDTFDFPQRMKFTAFDGLNSQNIELYINKVEFNKPIEINFSIPSRYTKGNIDNFKF